ncbi:MAG: OmpA family protein [Candidatus Kapabacteria bacterium]|nr:OmpA family protein [Candidatus Kapabacteria bacterium]
MMKILTLAIIMLIINFAALQSQMRTVVAVTGHAIEAITKNPVAIKIAVHDNTGKKINQVKSNASEGGYYYVTGLFPGNTYTFKIIEEGYFATEIAVSIPNTDKYIEISRDFLVNPLKKGGIIPVAVSPFEINKSKLRFGSSVVLDDIVNTLKSNKNVKFTIKTFPDNNIDTLKNENLTGLRAESLMDYFVTNGISPERITVEGASVTDPNKPPPTEKRAKGKRYIGSAYIIINDF